MARIISVINNTYLAVGRTVDVEVTPFIEDLIAKGYLAHEGTARVYVDPDAAQADASVWDEADEHQTVEALQTAGSVWDAPPSTATKKEWVAFLENLKAALADDEIPFDFDPQDTKVNLMFLYDELRASREKTDDPQAVDN